MLSGNFDGLHSLNYSGKESALCILHLPRSLGMILFRLAHHPRIIEKRNREVCDPSEGSYAKRPVISNALHPPHQ